MELSRRDALGALAAAGVVAGGALSLQSSEGGFASEPDGEAAALVSLAEVLYPSEIEGIEAFLAEYVGGRIADRAAYGEGVREAVAYLDSYAESWHGAAFAELDPATREEALRSMGADAADPDPEGTDAERVRYYLVNELLFALYASPTGGELVGIENPRGNPGGLSSYRRGPPG
jgi:hypothetical protein